MAATAIGVVCGCGAMVTERFLLPVPLTFVALMVPLNVPPAGLLGVPENKPVDVLKFTPGIDTVVAQPPEGMTWSAVIWYENEEPAVPLAVLALVIVGTGGAMLRTSVALPVPPALVALMVTLKFPFVVGVPVIAPVLVFTLSPEGNPVALKLV